MLMLWSHCFFEKEINIIYHTERHAHISHCSHLITHVRHDFYVVNVFSHYGRSMGVEESKDWLKY